MQLTLTDAEVHALRIALDSYFSDLREEIYHTDSYDDRQTLKGLEQALAGIRTRLEPDWQAQPGYPAGGPDPGPITGGPSPAADGPVTPSGGSAGAQ